MKRILYLIICGLVISVTAYGHNYYWYKGEKVFLQEGNMYYVVFNGCDTATMPSTLLINKGKITSGNGKCTQMWGIVQQENLTKLSNLQYQSRSFLVNDSTNIYVTQRFYVKLKKKEDLSILKEMASKYSVYIDKEGEINLWYVLKCEDQVPNNALELSNVFYESRLFDAVEPEFINIIQPLCVNDTYFDEQWNLENIGQYGSSGTGVDINFCEAHSITKGNSSVIIAVLDEGVQLSHPDINVYSSSYDAHSSSASVIYGSHGTSCAGIISAKVNNSLGVAGIAPNCPVMSISFSSFTATQEIIARGFRLATEHNVSVINCSWCMYIQSECVENAIDSALTYGRNGKGCVIAFAAGNSGIGLIDYPANYNPDILVVGAMTPQGKRKVKNNDPFGENDWGSSYGSQLDIMAPGIRIPTTDITGSGGYSGNSDTLDYYMRFGGTSGACPHVTSVAGLMLSVNSSLTQKEVGEIIESTAQKVGGYSYTLHSERLNGLWNQEMGYGLVDAYAAVHEAINRYPIQGPEIMCDTAKYYLLHPLQSGETVLWDVHNGEVWNPHYSIIGPNNQDTVVVICQDATLFRGGNNSEDIIIPPMVDNRKFLSATITSSNATSETYTKNLRNAINAAPIIHSSDTATQWLGNTERTFTITNCLFVPDSSLRWAVQTTTLRPRPHTVTSYFYGRTLSYTPLNPMIFPFPIKIKIFAANSKNSTCPEAFSDTLEFTLIRQTLSLAYMQEGDILNINILEESKPILCKMPDIAESDRLSLELWHYTLGCLRKQPAVSPDVQMDINNLPHGVYVLLLKDQGEVIAQDKVLIK